MPSNLKLTALASVAGLSLVAGCHKQSYRPPPPPCTNCPPPGAIGAPPGGFSSAPPAGFAVPPSGYTNQPAVPAAPGGVQPLPTQPGGVPRTGNISQYPSQGVNPAGAKLGPVTDGAVAPAHAVAPLEVPTEIPRFALVGDHAAAGLVPFAEGYAWLKAKGYRTLLLVKAPGEDDSAVAEAAKKAGLAFVAIDLSASVLDQAKAEEFARKLKEDGPVFVCDRSGELAGVLWFVHFRLTEQQPAATATPRAERLGLKADAEEGATKELWEAAKKLAP